MSQSPTMFTPQRTPGAHIRGNLVWGVVAFVVGGLAFAAYSALTAIKAVPPVVVNVNTKENQPPHDLMQDPVKAEKVEAEKVVTPWPPYTPNPNVKTTTAPVQPKPPRQETEAEKALKAAMKADTVIKLDDEQTGNKPGQVLEIGATEQDKSPFALDGTEYPVTEFMLVAGDTIPVTLYKGINSELPGKAYGIVAYDVYSANGHKLVPQGAKVQLTYDHGTVDGQGRLLVLADRIMLPCSKRFPYGSSVGLQGNSASDVEGYVGLKDKVNRHWLKSFGSALVYAAVAAGVSVANGGFGGGDYYGSDDPSSAATRALGREMDRASHNALRRGENQAPTFTIRPGQRFTITLDKDVPFAGPFESCKSQQISMQQVTQQEVSNEATED